MPDLVFVRSAGHVPIQVVTPGGVVALSIASDLRSRGRGFDSRPGLRRKNSGQVSHTYVPLSPSSISWYRPKHGDALRLGSKGRHGSYVGGKYKKLRYRKEDNASVVLS